MQKALFLQKVALVACLVAVAALGLTACQSSGKPMSQSAQPPQPEQPTKPEHPEHPQ